MDNKLLEAAWDGDFGQIQVALQSGANIEAIGSQHNGTALYGAARQGHYHICDLLLQNCANPNSPCGSPWFYTPIHQAAFYNRLEIAQLLIAYGADANARIPANSNFGAGKLPHEIVGMIEGPPNPALVTLLKSNSTQMPMPEPVTSTSESTRGGSGVIKDTFDVFDSTGQGFITMRDIVMVSRKQRQLYSESELREMFDDIDVDRDRRIGWNEFECWWVSGQIGEGEGMKNMCNIIAASMN